ncbi:bifunctional UDP-N-acetylglucosamine diphosphorylase/glucosamine-1-phosphate N-acetyltransferase GlmU [Sulfuriflexus sp.]|uniref:bifunctional UDP-N-acetylglucosamine diphosphorylase/glucosamine-1-phosphate N-acetyltransferase GlmU n=1 Tax=Sulfuriflexus sp. TaxID=2015443 RepID=UPI0028CEF2E9|nr:bifunctional UDP-N-acetylglucosamine diphosphorylase/glucosamine-1-phosphate N-acetyltransferase GlmU [Sulfuriflexus sp.]MDT8404109.1 bifunctional UDP-N-acetylglucosamine diphosphorylase/glucosamine-1-phosphate N-acetyltransferase GlmU [Sulfuriflexus sp.]
MTCNIIILAAGQGTRMRSALPKVLHKLADKSLLEHVCQTANTLAPSQLNIIYGHGGERVRQALVGLQANWIEQAEQLGTGHAVTQALPYFEDDETVLILYGDVPLTKQATLHALLDQVTATSMGLLTIELPDPTGYGRIIRDAAGKVERIVEHKDATAAERAITEVNTGMLAVNGGRLKDWLGKLGNDNAQGEYYLTDIIGMAVADGVEVKTVQASHRYEVEGVNDRLQLARLERYYQSMKAEELMQAGVTLRDPARLDIRGELKCGQDVQIDINVIIEGRVRLGDNVQIGPNVMLKDCVIAAGARIEANCVIEQAEIGASSIVGPFARLRPGTRLAAESKVGNFVEIKNATIGEGSKVNHLSYIGDARLGKDVNIGAGTITCNYDGANKHQTVIGDKAFIGSCSQLVAPVEIGSNATIGAGSTISKDAPADALTLSRSPQKTLKNWQRPTKNKE